MYPPYQWQSDGAGTSEMYHDDDDDENDGDEDDGGDGDGGDDVEEYIR